MFVHARSISPQTDVFRRACAEKPRYAHSVCTRSANSPRINRFFEGVCRKYAPCAHRGKNSQNTVKTQRIRCIRSADGRDAVGKNSQTHVETASPGGHVLGWRATTGLLGSFDVETCPSTGTWEAHASPEPREEWKSDS